MDTSRRLWAEAFGTFCLVFAGTGAVISMRFDSLWIYLLAPVAGAVARVPLFHRIHPERIHPEPGDRVRHAEDL